MPVYASRLGAFALEESLILIARGQERNRRDPTDADRDEALVSRATRLALHSGAPRSRDGQDWRALAVDIDQCPLQNVLDLDRAERAIERRLDLVWITAASPVSDYESDANTLEGLPWHLGAAGFPENKLQDPQCSVGVIDVGIGHEGPLASTVVTTPPWDPSTPEYWYGQSVPSTSHGTRCVGVIVADDKDPRFTPQVLGVAPGGTVRGCNLWAWSNAAVKWGLENAITKNSVDVLSMSFAYDSSLTPQELMDLEALLYRANRQGVLLVAAAGNIEISSDTPNTWEPISFPARNPHVIAVGAIGRDMQLVWGRNGWGSRHGRVINAGHRTGVSVVAPGVDIRTVDLDCGPDVDLYHACYNFSGTSAAAPQVAGLALLLVEKYSALRGNPARVREIIEGTAEKLAGYDFAWDSPDDPSTRNDQVGYGLISAKDALDLADVAIKQIERIEGEDRARFTVSVLNRGPATAEGLSLWAWEVSRSTYWQIVRNQDGGYSLFGDDLVEVPPTQFFADSLDSGDTAPIEVQITTAAPSEGVSCVIILVDTAKDHAFYKALLPLPPFMGGPTTATHGIVATDPVLLRGYNNLRIVDLDPPKIVADLPEKAP